MDSQPKNKLDRWLERLSLISQFGLFLITIGALYFTVLPLYQKAVLDEAIARKELELKKTTEDLEKSYVTVRQYIVREYVSYYGAKCSGLLDPAEPAAQYDKPRPKRISRGERMFTLDVSGCLNDGLNTQKSVNELRPKDHKFLVQSVADINATIAEKRQAAMRDHEKVPEQARTNPDSLPQPTGMRAEFQKLVDDFRSRTKIENPEESKRAWLKLAIKVEQDRIAVAYADEIRKAILSLRDLKWPKD